MVHDHICPVTLCEEEQRMRTGVSERADHSCGDPCTLVQVRAREPPAPLPAAENSSSSAARPASRLCSMRQYFSSVPAEGSRFFDTTKPDDPRDLATTAWMSSGPPRTTAMTICPASWIEALSSSSADNSSLCPRIAWRTSVIDR